MCFCKFGEFSDLVCAKFVCLCEETTSSIRDCQIVRVTRGSVCLWGRYDIIALRFWQRRKIVAQSVFVCVCDLIRLVHKLFCRLVWLLFGVFTACMGSTRIYRWSIDPSTALDSLFNMILSAQYQHKQGWPQLSPVTYSAVRPHRVHCVSISLTMWLEDGVMSLRPECQISRWWFVVDVHTVNRRRLRRHVQLRQLIQGLDRTVWTRRSMNIFGVKARSYGVWMLKLYVVISCIVSFCPTFHVVIHVQAIPPFCCLQGSFVLDWYVAHSRRASICRWLSLRYYIEKVLAQSPTKEYCATWQGMNKKSYMFG